MFTMTAPMFGSLTPFGAMLILLSICLFICFMAWLLTASRRPTNARYQYAMVESWNGEMIEKVVDLQEKEEE